MEYTMELRDCSFGCELVVDFQNSLEQSPLFSLQERARGVRVGHSGRLQTTGRSASRSKAEGEAGVSVGVVLEAELSGVRLR